MSVRSPIAVVAAADLKVERLRLHWSGHALSASLTFCIRSQRRCAMWRMSNTEAVIFMGWNAGAKAMTVGRANLDGVLIKATSAMRRGW